MRAQAPNPRAHRLHELVTQAASRGKNEVAGSTARPADRRGLERPRRGPALRAEPRATTAPHPPARERSTYSRLVPGRISILVSDMPLNVNCDICSLTRAERPAPATHT